MIGDQGVFVHLSSKLPFVQSHNYLNMFSYIAFMGTILILQLISASKLSKKINARNNISIQLVMDKDIHYLDSLLQLFGTFTLEYSSLIILSTWMYIHFNQEHLVQNMFWSNNRRLCSSIHLLRCINDDKDTNRFDSLPQLASIAIAT